MSDRSRPGSTPCVNRFSASVTMSTLPVRSPLPNRQPSTRSPPAISASSVAATAVPRSLCGCSEMITLSRRGTLRQNHSIMSACRFGVDISTVAGRFSTSRSLRGRLDHVLHGGAHLERVVELGAGERLGRVLVADLLAGAGGQLLGTLAHPGRALRGDLHDARAILAEHDAPLQLADRVVEVHDRPRDALQADSNVRSIRCLRHCTSTTIVTSSGIRSSSTSVRMKSKSAFDADGKPTSISLKPISTSSLNRRRLRSPSIGLISAWLPSRRSTDTHCGAVVRRRRARSGRAARRRRRDGSGGRACSWRKRLLDGDGR